MITEKSMSSLDIPNLTGKDMSLFKTTCNQSSPKVTMHNIKFNKITIRETKV